MVSSSGVVTILFTDLVGSTELSSQIGDVAADGLRRDHFVDLRGAIAETGGREVKTIGDAVMVAYGGAADALAGAVSMQRAVDRRNRSAEGPTLAMRVGVSAGDATFEDDDWFGTPVVEAARLCAAAEGGQILVTDVVRALAGSRSPHEVAALGERDLKGLPEPISVCEVTWVPDEDVAAVDAAVPLPGFVETVPTFPFAGRAAERERLVTVWKEAAEGSRRVVMVSGEPGVGKTRLVTEVVKMAHEQGALLLWGRCAEELDVPYQPFVEALRHYVHSVPADRLRAELGPLGGEMTRLIPDLAHLVPGIPDPVRTDAETERHRLFEAVGDLIDAVGRTTPIVLVLDDVHWADKPSLLLLRHLLRRSDSLPLLILATYRDTDLDRSHPLSDVLADLRREPGVERLDLRGLDPAEVTDFMEFAAGHDLEGPALELAAAVHQETQGNPFFIGEMLLHLAESGLIVQRGGRWESDFSLTEVGIPEGIREVVGRRISRLSDTANTVLTIAAVIGQEFDAAVIEAISGVDGDAVFDALDEAARASIVREVTGRFGRYAFAHALVRSTLYEELSTNRRVRMHAQIGDALEAAHVHDLDHHLDALAHHYSEGALAGDPAKAVDYGRRAAAAAIRDLAFEAGVRHLDRALAALDLIAAPDPATTFDLQLELTRALRAGFDPRFHEAGFAAAETARQMDDPARLAAAALAFADVNTSAQGTLDEELISLIESALDALPPEPSPVRSRLLTLLAVELQWGGDGLRRGELGREGLAMARATGDAEALGAALLSAWASVDGSAPFVERFTEYAAEARALAVSDPAYKIWALRTLAFMGALRGDPEAVAENLPVMLEIVEELRQPRHIWLARNDAATISAFTGALDLAEEQAMGAMTYGFEHDLDETRVMSWVGGLLYAIRRGQGRADELVPTLEGLVESSPGAPVWHVALAGALVESGRADEAVEHVDFLTSDTCAAVPADIQFPVTMCSLGRLSRVVSIDRATLRHIYDRLLPFAGTFNWSGVSITDANDYGLAVAAARLGDFEASDAHFRAAIELSERAGARSYLASTHLDWARLLAERGETARAAEQVQLALGLAHEVGSTGPFGIVTLGQELLDQLSP